MLANAVARSHIVRAEDPASPGRMARVGDLSNALQKRAAVARAESGPDAVRHLTTSSPAAIRVRGLRRASRRPIEIAL